MKITIGIMTYNRPEYLNKLRESLLSVKSIEKCNIRLYDDNSPIWDNKNLKKFFPEAKEIVRSDKNLGPDKHMRKMFIDFLKTGDDVLVIADEDLLFHPDSIYFIIKNIKYTDGVMSLYNSYLHNEITETIIINSQKYISKKHIGAAGTVMERGIVEKIITNVPESIRYDWDWSNYLVKNNFRLLVKEDSYVQHIGVEGYNSRKIVTDFGLNFYPGNKINEKYNTEFFQELIINRYEMLNYLSRFKIYKIFKISAEIIISRIQVVKKLKQYLKTKNNQKI